MIEECDDYYDIFREIRRRKIDTKQLVKDYGKRTPFILNFTAACVCKRGGVPFDELSDEYGFESTSDFYDFLMNYKPYCKWREEFREYYESYDE